MEQSINSKVSEGIRIALKKSGKSQAWLAEKMMKAKRVRISANVYQEGSPVFDFDVSGFAKSSYLPE